MHPLNGAPNPDDAMSDSGDGVQSAVAAADSAAAHSQDGTSAAGADG